MPISSDTLAALLDRHWGPLVAWVGPCHGMAEDVVQNACIAFSLTPHRALAELLKLERSIADLMERAKVPTAPPFLQKPTIVYFTLHRFDRRVKLLQTVESIRDHAARNDGNLPASLSELDLPAPDDPLTEMPFEYRVENGKATLQMATIPGIVSAMQRQIAYEISVVKQN